ncbi:MAG: GTP-binding protein, partial [Pseudohongiellaceae bacterium]
MIVVTAGHVDHGKTTLIRALTGKDTDSLAEEKARGMSINLGFAYHHFSKRCATGATRHHTLSFIDVPGHTDFIGNMLAGAWSADVAMIIVAADEGIMPQTREHVLILHLLGIKRA